METFLFSLSARTDERFLALSAVGRLTFLQAAAAFDGNWGHALYCPTAIIATAFPSEQSRADRGDRAAIAWMSEARKQLERAVELGLFIVEETPGGPVIAYKQWERYNGGKRSRGCPTAPMGLHTASTRSWSKLSACSRGNWGRWCEVNGLDAEDLLKRESKRAKIASTPAPSTEPQHETTDDPYSDAWYASYHAPMNDPCPGKGKGKGNGPLREAQTEREPTPPEWPPPRLKLEGEAARVVEEVSQRLHGQVYDHNLRKELPLTAGAFVELTSCDSLAEWIVASAVEAAAENKGKFVRDEFRYALRDFRRPKASSLSAARKLLGMEAQQTCSSGDSTPTVVKVCPLCGWEDSTGTARVCETHRRSELVPKETQEASPFARRSPESAREASVVAELG